MADLNTSLYASQGNGGSPRVLISEVAALASTGGTPATTTTLGVVYEAATVAALTSEGPGTPATGLVDVGAAFSQSTLNNNFATLGAKLDAILVAIKAAGLMA